MSGNKKFIRSLCQSFNKENKILAVGDVVVYLITIDSPATAINSIYEVLMKDQEWVQLFKEVS